MRILFSFLVFVAALNSIQAADQADNLAWGPVDHGLRIGIGLGPTTPEPQLRIVFENMERGECVLQLGSSSPKGAVYNIEFTLTAPGGKEFPAFNFNGPPGIQKGAQPIMIHLARSEKHEILQSLNKLIYIDNNGKNHPVTEMLGRHYSVRAAVDTTGTAQWSRTRAEWMGKVASGDLRR
jgi:hypothetical protein